MVLAVTAAGVLADTGWSHHWGGWGWLMMVGWWLVLAAIVVALVGIPGRRHAGPSEEAKPEAILARRFALGEIDADEYRDRLARLTS